MRPRPSPSPPPAPPCVLDWLARQAGLEPISSAEADIPFEAPNEQTLARALLTSGGAVLAIAHSGEHAVRTALVDAAAPFQRPDGSYRLKNRFAYLIAEPHMAHARRGGQREPRGPRGG